MALKRVTITAPTCNSFNSLGNSLTAVASSSAVIVGASANIVDHDIVITMTGPATMTASASTLVNFAVYGSHDGTSWTKTNTTNELVDGTDKAIVWSANGNQSAWLGNIPMHTTTAGTSIIYTSKIFSIASLFGGVMPARYVIIAQNQSSAALPASGHSIAVTELYYD